MRAWLAAVAIAAGILIVPAAGADIAPTQFAPALAGAITSDPSFVTGASFDAEPAGAPDAVSTTPLAGFPTNGADYAILSTGDARAASNPNTNQNEAQDQNHDDQSANDNGGPVRGDGDRDVTILRIGLNVPAGDNCLSFEFRFLSEEFPEFVGSKYNDAFIAELDSSTWTTSGADISAPNNFAFDPGHNVISINATGATSVNAANAAGTTYDGATPLLTASTPVTPGAHTLYLSIFDAGDNILDSAAFVDNLVIGKTESGGCVQGAQISPPAGNPTGTKTGTVTVNGRAYSGGPVPYNSTVDVTKGSVTLKTRAGTLQVSGSGVSAKFKLVKASENGKPLDELRLVGGNFGVCTSALRTTSGRAAPPPPKTVRRLFTKGKGQFRTRGNYASATIRGTSWVTTDRCDGTLVQTKQGVVEVSDFVKKVKVLVKAGKSYLARKGAIATTGGNSASHTLPKAPASAQEAAGVIEAIFTQNSSACGVARWTVVVTGSGGSYSAVAQVTGTHAGKATWTISGRTLTATNALAVAITAGCP